MNCQTVIANMGFQCRDIGGDILRIWSPFTYGNDGQCVGLYIEKTQSAYLVTDNAESFMHASSMGLNITAARVNSIRRAVSRRVTISDGGEISANSDDGELGATVADVLSAALAVGHSESAWRPKSKAESFTQSVAAILESTFKGRVRERVSVVGASGHQLELPLAIERENGLIYIQPIAANDETKVDWKSVYAGYGRMSDLKNAGATDGARVIVLEDATNDQELAKATSLLANSAAVVQFSKLHHWAQRMVA